MTTTPDGQTAPTTLERLLNTDLSASDPGSDELRTIEGGLPQAALRDYLQQHPQRTQAARDKLRLARQHTADPAEYQTALKTVSDQLTAEARLAFLIEDAPRVHRDFTDELNRYLTHIESI